METKNSLGSKKTRIKVSKYYEKETIKCNTSLLCCSSGSGSSPLPRGSALKPVGTGDLPDGRFQFPGRHSIEGFGENGRALGSLQNNALYFRTVLSGGKFAVKSLYSEF